MRRGVEPPATATPKDGGIFEMSSGWTAARDGLLAFVLEMTQQLGIDRRVFGVRRTVAGTHGWDCFSGSREPASHSTIFL